jgi:hypothetical protein
MLISTLKTGTLLLAPTATTTTRTSKKEQVPSSLLPQIPNLQIKNARDTWRALSLPPYPSLTPKAISLNVLFFRFSTGFLSAPCYTPR